MPILPMFLESLGAGGQAIGLVGGIRDSLSNLLQVLCGYWSDKTGKRKIFVYSGYAVSTVFKLLLALARTSPLAVVFSSLERTGQGPADPRPGRAHRRVDEHPAGPGLRLSPGRSTRPAPCSARSPPSFYSGS